MLAIDTCDSRGSVVLLREDVALAMANHETEEDYSWDAQAFYFAAFFNDLIGRLLVDAGHAADFGADVGAGADKHWVDEAVGGQAGFADQTADWFAAT